MRKFAVALTCVLALAMLAAPCLAEDASFIGTWTLTLVEAQGVTVDPAVAGIEMTMTINEDGSAILAAMGEQESGAWTIEGGNLVVTDEVGDGMVFAPQEDGTLRAEQEGMAMIFSLQGDSAAVESTSAPKEGVLQDVTFEDFLGDWVATHGFTLGQEFSMEMLGLEMTISVEDGFVTLLSNGEGGTVPAALEGNALIMEGTGDLIPIYMSEDGALLLTMEMGGMTIDFVFARAE